jgi:acetylornithine deacetylase/succinyl-diaminopimelate desuccinylase-like protein
VPLDGNAIYRLSDALSRLGRFKFPARLLPVTRAYFAARATVEKGEISSAMRSLAAAPGELPADAVKLIDAEPLLMPALHTTCVATLLSGGTRVNALPAEAKANVNCRVLPDETLEQVRAVLAGVLADPGIEIRPVSPFARAGASPVEGADIDAVKKIIGEMWPGAPVIPSMSYGASDSLFLRQAGIPAYGMSPIPNTDADGRRAHGIDERIPASGLRTGVEFFGKLTRELAVVR